MREALEAAPALVTRWPRLLSWRSRWRSPGHVRANRLLAERIGALLAVCWTLPGSQAALAHRDCRP
jgi:hypothetical protein